MSTHAADGPVSLRLEDVTKSFGGIRALGGVTTTVAAGSITGLIGPNGAGKTTLINCITGFYEADGGRVFLGEAEITGWPVSRVARSRLGRTFQNIALPPDMTVLDNVLLGTYLEASYGYVRGLLPLPSVRRTESRARGAATDAIDLVGLRGHADRPLGDLPHGQQKLVELARAVVQRPRLLLLDEPGAGVSDGDKGSLTDLIRSLRSLLGCTIVIVEHDMGMVMSLCDDVVVLDWGHVIAQGPPAAVQRDPAVLDSYLG